MKKIALLFALFTSALKAQNITLTQYAAGFTSPLCIANAGDDRLFIVEKAGIIKILNGDATSGGTFLNIDARVGSVGNEQGLLGLTFHPDYAVNGYFVVDYTDNAGDTKISRFSRSATDPNLADPNSEVVLLTIDQPYSNHNGGCVLFGPDGYLYIGMGDGGSAGDPDNNGQNNLALLGKMLRIQLDITGAGGYNIPSTNPFVPLSSVRNEIWATGVRNPWRFSFDRSTGDLWIGDVGQNAYEEIDFQPASSAGGENYGWSCREGNVAYTGTAMTTCGAATDYVSPVHVYAHGGGSASVTGGYVYRGVQEPNLIGKYYFNDYLNGKFYALTPDGSGGFVNAQVADLTNYNFVTYGEDYHGELYVAGLTDGKIYRLRDAACVTTPAIQPTVSESSFVLNSSAADNYQWFLNGEPIAGATAQTYTATANGSYTVLITNASGCTAFSTPYEILNVSVAQVTANNRNFTLFPSPANNVLNLDFKNANPEMVCIYNTMGEMVLCFHEVGNSLKVDVSELPSGVYFVEMHSENGRSTRKFLKQ